MIKHKNHRELNLCFAVNQNLIFSKQLTETLPNPLTEQHHHEMGSKHTKTQMLKTKIQKQKPTKQIT